MISTPFMRRIFSMGIQKCSLSSEVKLLSQKYFYWKKYRCFHKSSTNLRKKEKYILNNYMPKFPVKKKNLEAVEIWKNITVEELAIVLNTDPNIVISHLPSLLESEINLNTPIDTNISGEILKKFGKKTVIIKNPKLIKNSKLEAFEFDQPPSKPENLIKRPPVVTVMGHVDHGKTTLLDSLRNTFVVQQEFGGITQHIGAFSVEVEKGKKVTFIDTPGHAAFTTMRSRGAEVTDLVILVIAADDGIMEQTIESIRIANRANVNMIIAVNKIDKPKAYKIEDIKDKLLHEGIQVEDKGGNIQLIPISALKKINLDLLVEAILAEAEVMDLKGDPTGLVEGVIIESKINKRGILATVLVKRGTLKKGKIIVAGKAHARVRVMLDEKGQEYNEATPSIPVQILGWKELPVAGEKVMEVKSEKDATKLMKKFENDELKIKLKQDQETIKAKIEAHNQVYQENRRKFKSLTPQERNLFVWELRQNKSKQEETGPFLSLIVKGDVYGSLEVLIDVLNTYEQDHECGLSLVEASVGDVTPGDVDLAELFNAIIYAFNVKVHPNAQDLVKEKQINIRFHNVLYKLIDDVKSELNERIPPKDGEEVIGEAEVCEQFLISEGRKKVPVAGSKCTKGMLKKNCFFKVLKGEEVIYDGKVVSMKHFKNEVGTIQKNAECGLMFENFTGKFEPGDKIICYEKIKIPQKTSWDPGF